MNSLGHWFRYKILMKTFIELPPTSYCHLCYFVLHLHYSSKVYDCANMIFEIVNVNESKFYFWAGNRLWILPYISLYVSYIILKKTSEQYVLIKKIKIKKLFISSDPQSASFELSRQFYFRQEKNLPFGSWASGFVTLFIYGTK